MSVTCCAERGPKGADPVVSDTALSREQVPGLEHRLGAVRGRVHLEAGQAAAAARVVYAGMAAYAVLFVFAAVMHYSVFEDLRLDNGNMVQAI